MTSRLHAIVEGYVQGVGYRMFVVQEARRLEVNGWVRNRSDGTVEVMAEGERDDLREFLRVLKDGPHHGTVSNIQSSWSLGTGEFKQFWFRETY